MRVFAFARFPGCAQRVGQQGQGAGLAFDFAHQQVDEPGFQPQAGAAGGSLDRFAAGQRRSSG